MKICEGRVAIVTGAGRGVGQAYALMLAKHGAKVVINDLGGAPDGTGSDATPAEEVAAQIKKDGGEAVVNTADVTPELFSLLNAKPLAGRTLVAEDGKRGASAHGTHQARAAEAEASGGATGFG